MGEGQGRVTSTRGEEKGGSTKKKIMEEGTPLMLEGSPARGSSDGDLRWGGQRGVTSPKKKTKKKKKEGRYVKRIF